MARTPRETELEMENAHLRGRVEELEKRTKAAEDYANEVMCSGCDCDEPDAWPGDPNYVDADVVTYVDDFGVRRPVFVPTGEN